MEKLTVTVTSEKIEYNPYDDNNKHFIISGGQDPMSWEQYLHNYKEDFLPHIKLIRDYIEQNGLIGAKADSFCNDNTFKFIDGYYFGFSWRGWGDLMCAIVGNGTNYMDFYM